MTEACYDILQLRLERKGRGGLPGYRLDIADLLIARGARVGIVGPSGVGKSTLLDMLALIRQPDQARQFAMLGMDVARPLMAGRARQLTRLRRENISYILQDGGLLPYLNVGANAHLARKLSRRRGDMPVETIARHLGIGDLLHKLPASLSGGQRQRAAVLRGLASGAPIILADEPTAALDAVNARTAMQLLADLPEDRTVIVSSHQEDLLTRCGFHICRLSVLERSADWISVGLATDMAEDAVTGDAVTGALT